MTDMVNNPPHYQDASGIQCIEVTKFLGFCDGNCFKYLYRAGQKGDEIEDLEKAKWYAKQAKDMGVGAITDKAIIRKICKIAFCRGDQIGLAMHSIVDGFWDNVIYHIDMVITNKEK